MLTEELKLKIAKIATFTAFTLVACGVTGCANNYTIEFKGPDAQPTQIEIDAALSAEELKARQAQLRASRQHERNLKGIETTERNWIKSQKNIVNQEKRNVKLNVDGTTMELNVDMIEEKGLNRVGLTRYQVVPVQQQQNTR